MPLKLHRPVKFAKEDACLSVLTVGRKANSHYVLSVLLLYLYLAVQGGMSPVFCESEIVKWNYTAAHSCSL